MRLTITDKRGKGDFVKIGWTNSARQPSKVKSFIYKIHSKQKGYSTMSSKEKRIGLVGVGRMGANMARNLKDKGYQVSCVNDVAKDVASSLAEELNCAHAECCLVAASSEGTLAEAVTLCHL